MACRSGRDGNAREARQYFAADLADERNVERVRQAVRGMSIEDDAISKRHPQLLPQAVAQSAHALHRCEITRYFARLAEPDRQKRTFRSRAPAAFVSGAVNQRFDRHATTHKESAGSLGGVDLVTGDSQQIDAELIHIGADLTYR